MSVSNPVQKSKIILPDDEKVREENFEDLIVEDLPDIEEEIKEEEENVKRKTVIQDDVPTADFFETKPDENEEKFGEIEGMSAVTPDEDAGEGEEAATTEETGEQLVEGVEQPTVSASVEASASAEDQEAEFTIEPATEEPATEESAPEEPATEESAPEEPTPEEPAPEEPAPEESAPEVEAERASIHTEEGGISQVVSLKDSHEDDVSVAQVSRVTMLEDRETVAKMRETSSDQKGTTTGAEEESRARVFSEVSSVRSALPSQVTGMPRTSILYDIAGRIEVSGEEDLQQFFELDKQDDFRLPDDFDEGAEEESAHTIAEEEEVALDRTPYYEKYDVLVKELAENRIRNNILQKMVIMYLKRRKVENILKDSEPPLDQLVKYGQKLDAYQQLMKINSTQTDMKSTEVNTLRKKRDEKSIELKKLFKDMQTREANIGYGLIYAKTGNQVPDKLVERLIRRQANQMDQVSVMRLKYIKLKGMVQEKLDAIYKIDTIENNLHLTDYEQLKAENRSHADKIEERDEELTRLRNKCQNTIQILAHLREKSAALDSDLFDLREEFEMVKDAAQDLRENLAELKHSRDKYRQMAKKIKDESGLLTKTDMLRDMEESQKEIVRIEIELARCKEDAESKTEEVRRLRKNIERITKILRKKAAKAKNRRYTQIILPRKSKFQQSISQSEDDKIYKGRPTLYVPYIKDTAFDGIVKIKPSPFINTRRRR